MKLWTKIKGVSGAGEQDVGGAGEQGVGGAGEQGVGGAGEQDVGGAGEQDVVPVFSTGSCDYITTQLLHTNTVSSA